MDLTRAHRAHPEEGFSSSYKDNICTADPQVMSLIMLRCCDFLCRVHVASTRGNTGKHGAFLAVLRQTVATSTLGGRRGAHSW